MALKRDFDEEIDVSYLSVDYAADRLLFHRDWQAHLFRWGHVLKSLRITKPDRILDIGCGIEAPLAKSMFSNRQTMHQYLGVDYGNVKYEESRNKFNPTFFEKYDASKLYDEDKDKVIEILGGAPTMFTSFEVVEHMAPDRAALVLAQVKKFMSESGGIMFLSTPCYSKKSGAAKNHINEFTLNGMKHFLLAAGFKIEKSWGTFASQRDYKKVIVEKFGEAGEALWKATQEFYHVTLLSNFWAPLFPELSRNVLWRLSNEDNKSKCAESIAFIQKAIGEGDSESLGQYEDITKWAKALEILQTEIDGK